MKTGLITVVVLLVLIGAVYAVMASNPLVIMPDLSMLPDNAAPVVQRGFNILVQAATESSDQPLFIVTYTPLVQAFDISAYSNLAREQIGGGVFDGYCTEMRGLGYSRLLLVSKHRDRSTGDFYWGVIGGDPAKHCAACGICD